MQCGKWSLLGVAGGNYQGVWLWHGYTRGRREAGGKGQECEATQKATEHVRYMTPLCVVGLLILVAPWTGIPYPLQHVWQQRMHSN